MTPLKASCADRNTRDRSPDPSKSRVPAAPGQGAAAPGTLRWVLRVASTVFAMAGWRLEHLNLIWVAGSVVSVYFAHELIAHADVRLTIPYFLFTLAFYYGGNAALLRSNLPSRAVACLGEERAFRAYETLAGLMFLNQGLGVGCMAALHMSRMEQTVPASLVFVAGAMLFIIGLLIKLWATLTVGVDAYYFRDMFLGRALAPASDRGPYRFVRNPMYSFGQLQGYGYALLAGSLPGVVAAGIGHALIYAFYLCAERPFVRRIYLSPAILPAVRRQSIGV